MQYLEPWEAGIIDGSASLWVSGVLHAVRKIAVIDLIILGISDSCQNSLPQVKHLLTSAGRRLFVGFVLYLKY